MYMYYHHYIEIKKKKKPFKQLCQKKETVKQLQNQYNLSQLI